VPPWGSTQTTVSRSNGGFARSLGSRLVMMPSLLSYAAAGNRLWVLVAFRTEQQAQAHCPNELEGPGERRCSPEADLCCGWGKFHRNRVLEYQITFYLRLDFQLEKPFHLRNMARDEINAI
jgi:hypothetical protein